MYNDMDFVFFWSSETIRNVMVVLRNGEVALSCVFCQYIVKVSASCIVLSPSA